MFTYPDLETESYKGQRWYDAPGGPYPSITTILGFTETPEKKASLKRWQDALGPRAAEISRAATDRGTNVHLLCERFLKGEPITQGDSFPQADLNSFMALKTKLKHVSSVWGQECALYSHEVQLAGRCDLVGIYRDKPTIVDFKTSSRIKNAADIGNYKVQLAFYGLAHNEMFGTNIEDGVVLMVSEQGFPQEFKIKLVDYYPELRERAASFWLAAVNSL